MSRLSYSLSICCTPSCCTSSIFHFRFIKTLMTLSLLCWMTMALPSLAQDMGYARELPTLAEIEKRFAVPDLEQSLGRQCAVMDMLWRGTGFFTYKEIDKPELQKARQQYLDGIAGLRERYAREVRPLDTPEAQRLWRDRLCANRPDGINPMTGKKDKSFPGLKQPVTGAEVIAMFKPSVMAAYERRVEEGKRAESLRAASDERQTKQAELQRIANESADSQRTFEFLVLLTAQAAGWGLLIWLIIMAFGRTSAFDKARNIVEIGQNKYDLKSVEGTVTGAPQKSRETVVTGGGGGGGPNNAPVSVSISSYTITHDTIFIKDAQGNTHHLQLRNWDFPSADGHQIQAEWLERKGKWIGEDYVIIRNFTIDKSLGNTAFLEKLIAPLHEGVVFILMTLACLMTIGFGLILAVPVWFWMRSRWAKQAQKLAESIRDEYSGGFTQST